MKRLVLMMIPALICGMVFTGCGTQGGSDPKGLSIKVDNIEGIEHVAQINAYIVQRELWWDPTLIAEASFVNNGFELHLPPKIPVTSLFPVAGEHAQNISISAPSAKWAFLEIDIKSNDNALYLFLTNDNAHNQPDNKATKDVIYIYVDRPVRLSGEVTEMESQPPWSSLYLPYETERTTTYSNLSLETGWNIVCREVTNDFTSDELKKRHFTYSNKNTSDCKWNLIVHPR